MEVNNKHAYLIMAHQNFEQLAILLELLIIPGLSEPPVRTLRATIPENESHIFR